MRYAIALTLTIGLAACGTPEAPARGVHHDDKVVVELAPAVVVETIPTELGPATILVP
jgi:hypothetical protein